MRHIRVLPWILAREPAATRKKKANKRSASHRRFTQEHVQQMRAECAAAGRTPTGRIKKGCLAAISVKWGVSRHYLWLLTTGGLRDDERETEGRYVF